MDEETETIDPRITEGFKQTNKLMSLPEIEDLVKTSAKLVFVFYSELVELGMDEDHAALVAASYSSNVANTAK